MEIGSIKVIFNLDEQGIIKIDQEVTGNDDPQLNNFITGIAQVIQANVQAVLKRTKELYDERNKPTEGN